MPNAFCSIRTENKNKILKTGGLLIMVKVYSITTCPWCDKVKKYLKSKNVEFENHNIELSEEDRDECYKISGDLIVPVTVVEGKDGFVVGFEKAKLDALLGL